MSSSLLRTTKWRPLAAFENFGSKQRYTADQQSQEKIALILVTTQLNEQNEDLLEQLWSNAAVKLCADGASNVLHNWSARKNAIHKYIPNFICGDLDSIKSESVLHYENIGTKVIRLDDQNYTDFTKTLNFTLNLLRKHRLDKDFYKSYSSSPEHQHHFDPFLKHEINQIYCLGSFGGRVDHALANMNTLFSSTNLDVNTFIVSEEGITFLLNEGRNLIYLSNKTNITGKYCGFFPLLGPTCVTTCGFKWNLNKEICSFDGIISSSNEFDLQEMSDENYYAYIETDKPLLFTMSIKPVCISSASNDAGITRSTAY
jgi:thiamine pyrophosphokinase